MFDQFKVDMLHWTTVMHITSRMDVLLKHAASTLLLLVMRLVLMCAALCGRGDDTLIIRGCSGCAHDSVYCLFGRAGRGLFGGGPGQGGYFEPEGILIVV